MGIVHRTQWEGLVVTWKQRSLWMTLREEVEVLADAASLRDGRCKAGRDP